MNVFMVLVLFGLMHAIRSFDHGSVASSVGISLALGYLLLTGYFFGRIFAQMRLPKLTGYIVAGIVVGPYALGLLNEHMVDSLRLVNGMAVAMIALTAGTELELQAMKPLFRTIRWVTLISIVGTTLLLTITVVMMRGGLPFLQNLDDVEVMAVAVVLGVVIVAPSPAVVVALKNELLADGPIARTVLGVVVIGNLLVLLLFAIASSVAKPVLGTGGGFWVTIGSLAWELLGSIFVGAALGYLLSIYMAKVQAGSTLFLLTLAFVIAEVGQRLHFDPLLVALSAGVLIRNMTTSGDAVHRSIEASALPIYILFFAVAGAALHLDLLAVLGLPAACIVAVRAFGLLSGAYVAALVVKAETSMRRYAGFGLLPQAGLALALAMLFAKIFPEFGSEASALVLSVVSINELLAPAAYRWALIQSGETGKSTTESATAETA